MPTYAIGDLQGCLDELLELCGAIGFQPARDRLWIAGDLVNRGPRSLETLRWLRDAGDAAVCVLGNHDLNLLAVAAGVRQPRPRDTLAPVLSAGDRDELLDWLRQRPLLHVQAGRVLVHAGLHPGWTVARAAALAAEVEAALRGDRYIEALAAMYAERRQPQWRDELTGFERIAAIAAVLTRLRVCRPDGTADYGFSKAPQRARPGYLPWFDVPGRASADHRVVFGHWSTLGLVVRPDVVATDTGCVWGRALTGVRLEDGQVFQVPCRRQ